MGGRQARQISISTNTQTRQGEKGTCYTETNVIRSKEKGRSHIETTEGLRVRSTDQSSELKAFPTNHTSIDDVHHVYLPLHDQAILRPSRATTGEKTDRKRNRVIAWESRRARHANNLPVWRGDTGWAYKQPEQLPVYPPP